MNKFLSEIKKVKPKMMERFNFELHVLTERRTINANRNKVFGLIYDGKEFAHSCEYTTDMFGKLGAGMHCIL